MWAQGPQGSIPAGSRGGRAQGRAGPRVGALSGAGFVGRPAARPHFPKCPSAGCLSLPQAGLASIGFTCRSQCLPHLGPGTLPGGFSGGRCGCRAWGRRLRTSTCRRGHRQYLRSGPPYDFPRYRSKVHEVTQAFAAVSREVLAVEAELAGPRAQPLLAGHVRSLQQLEQTRLATVRPRPRPLPATPSLVSRVTLGPLCASWARGHFPDPTFSSHFNLPLKLHLGFSGFLVSTSPSAFITGF